ncbi:hypothetical protein [Actinomadura viridis]|uniref:Uncharacterized protein n=1 Tax=Actinomadura viridis TaxID=58110 RepID=A0A931GSQ5_9ACTN|nr:hypothetical protein [Actinomadura viridis]MBG6091099.1 hypothetical protein [Actinomadura viridis]
MIEQRTRTTPRTAPRAPHRAACERETSWSWLSALSIHLYRRAAPARV